MKVSIFIITDDILEFNDGKRSNSDYILVISDKVIMKNLWYADEIFRITLNLTCFQKSEIGI